MKSDYNGLVEQSEVNQSVDENFNTKSWPVPMFTGGNMSTSPAGGGIDVPPPPPTPVAVSAGGTTESSVVGSMPRLWVSDWMLLRNSSTSLLISVAVL
jgi:hypothetical protein